MDEKKHLKLLLWPGNSVDINPTESLWDVLKDEILEVPITNKTQLLERLICIWFPQKKSRVYGFR